MAEKENEQPKGETANQGEAPPDNAINGKKPFWTTKKLETVVAVLLGVTTLLSAWASWIGHLHGGLQSINFTKSNNMASKSTTEYTLGMQTYLADFMMWNTAKEYYYDLEEAEAEGDEEKVELLKQKIESFEYENASEILAKGVKWMEENNEDSPFKMPGMAEMYIASAKETLNESQDRLEEGMRDNTKGDSYMLVTVIFSLTLFLLGIVNTFKNAPNRIAVMAIAVAFLVFAVVYMCTIPLPTGFAEMNFFEFNR